MTNELEYTEAVENEVAATMEGNELEEVMEQANDNQVWKLVGTAAASLATGLTAGWFGRGAVEARRREKMFDEIQKHICLIEKASQGEEEVEWNGRIYTTKGINVNTIDELKAYIMDNVLNNKKVKTSERENWHNLLNTLAVVQHKLFLREKIVVDEK